MNDSEIKATLEVGQIYNGVGRWSKGSGNRIIITGLFDNYLTYSSWIGTKQKWSGQTKSSFPYEVIPRCYKIED